MKGCLKKLSKGPTMPARSFHPPKKLLGYSCLAALLWIGTTAAGDPPAKTTLPSAFAKEAPETLQDLKDIQNHVQELAKKVIPCTVGIRIGPTQGSGVIIDKEGHVLTAGHVSGTPGQKVTLILSDGREVKGKTLGANRDIDSGMIQITDKGPFPFVDMGNSGRLKKGQWCMVLGHPAGYKTGRPPVVRLGRILDHGNLLIRTDCTLLGGDSGGPVFDMEGKVIGINSRINNPLTVNIHVPVDTYRDSFDRLAKGEVWGGKRIAGAYMGVELDPEAKDCRIRGVASGSPADKAGLQADDIVVMCDGKKINTMQDLISLVAQKSPGTTVAVQVRRGSEAITLRVTLGKRPA
jgi:serine protease Do